ncbi:ABC transporter ATP-binding protein [Nocardioides limicola]|uniref:ABC transporter ATP-binding protein n=1 Tax=Nocardioides limicola TaxID=2803368 RepID=UPI00193BD4F4
MSLLEVRDLKVHFPIRKGILLRRIVGYVQAVDGVSLSVDRGQTYGLVGESGCGKSTVGRAILRLNDITAGEVRLDGTDLAGLSTGAMRRQRHRLQMIFQDPMGSLDPRQNIESILGEGLAAHGMGGSRRERRKTLIDALDAVGLSANALARYPHEFSGGQRQRIGIARALVLQPDVIICDEPVSALDVSVQAQVLNLLEEIQEQTGVAYVVIAHDLAVVRHISDTVGVMYLGHIMEEAAADDLYAEPLHPYTKALMSAIPVPDPEVEAQRERILLTGDLPSPANPPAGCRFSSRCPWAQSTRCHDEIPALIEVRPGHRVACHWVEEIESGEIRPHEVEAEMVPASEIGVEIPTVEPPAVP